MMVPVIFQRTNSENMPIAMTITGTTSGDRMSALAMLLPGNFPRAMPREASVPRIEAATAVQTATSKLLTKPDVQVGLVSMFWYHWSEKPGGGNSRILEDEKPIGMM